MPSLCLSLLTQRAGPHLWTGCSGGLFGQKKGQWKVEFKINNVCYGERTEVSHERVEKALHLLLSRMQGLNRQSFPLCTKHGGTSNKKTGTSVGKCKQKQEQYSPLQTNLTSYVGRCRTRLRLCARGAVLPSLQLGYLRKPLDDSSNSVCRRVVKGLAEVTKLQAWQYMNVVRCLRTNIGGLTIRRGVPGVQGSPSRLGLTRVVLDHVICDVQQRTEKPANCTPDAAWGRGLCCHIFFSCSGAHQLWSLWNGNIFFFFKIFRGTSPRASHLLPPRHVFSLSSYRHSYIGLLYSSRFIDS
jgi:hypothetical protein